MRPGTSYIEKVNRPLLRKGMALCCCLVLVFNTCFTLAHGSLAVNTAAHDHCIVSGGNFPAYDHKPAGFPGPGQTPETPDEVETGDNGDDNPTKLFWGLIAARSLHLHTGRSVFLHLKLSHESRSAVSLVILHHSWKSFLS